MDCESPSALKPKVRSANCFSCCFHATAADDDDDGAPSLIRSSSIWIRSKAQELPEIKKKCRTLICRMGGGAARHRRRGQSADFRYDPLSYALNFDEGNGADDLDFAVEEEFHNFSSRLPASPPVAPTRAAATVGVACS